MYTTKFIKPLIDHPNSLITNELYGKTYTYKDVYKEVLAIENKCISLNLKKNTIVIIYGFRSSFDALVLFFFCIKNELIPFIIEKGNLSYIDDLNFNIIITSESINYKKTKEIKEYEFGKIYQNSQENLYTGESNNFAIVSSSGTTSNIVKKILLGKKETLENIKSNQDALSLSVSDTTLVLLPISYSYGLIAQFFSHLLLGSDIVLTDKILGVLQIPHLLKKHNITNVFMTPLMCRLLFHYNRSTRSIENNLRFITLGGDKPNKEGIKKLQNTFGCAIYPTYGLAEAGPRVSTNKIGNNGLLTLELGIPNPGISMDIIKDEKFQRLCGIDQIGYLHIKTPSIYLGYVVGKTLQKPQCNTSLKTKDICIKDDDGIHLLGRDEDYIIKKDRIIWFYEIGDDFYRDPNVLKVKMNKEIKNRLNISVYHRNQITTESFSKTLFNKYGLTKDSEYFISLVEFNTSQYK